MLVKEEQEALYTIIASTLGEDPVIKALTMSFTERTVEVTETIITENAKCNGAFRELLAALGGRRHYDQGLAEKNTQVEFEVD